MIKLLELLESGTSYKDILFNPEHDDAFFGDIMRKYPDVEYYNGKYGSVFVHPSWKYAVKTFSNDIPYLKFVRFALQHPRKSFPKFYDKPRKYVPRYKRTTDKSFIYVVPIEKLHPINEKDFDNILFYSYWEGIYKNLVEKLKTDPDAYINSSEQSRQIYDICKKIERELPSISDFIEDRKFLFAKCNKFGTEDFHYNNVMQRPNGDLVYIDPFWEGHNVYKHHDKLMKQETDYYGDHGPMYLKGGELPRRKKNKPVKVGKLPQADEELGDVPF